MAVDSQFWLVVLCLGVLVGLSVLAGSSASWPNGLGLGRTGPESYQDPMTPKPQRSAAYAGIFPSVVDRGHDYRFATRALSAQPVERPAAFAPLRSNHFVGATENFTDVPLKAVNGKKETEPDGMPVGTE